MKNINLSVLLQNENKWVALSFDQKHIIESGKTIEAIEKKLRRKKIEDVIISFIPPADKSISP